MKVILASIISIAIMLTLTLPVLDLVDSDNDGILRMGIGWLTISLGCFAYSLFFADTGYWVSTKKRDARGFSIFSAILGSILFVIGLFLALT